MEACRISMIRRAPGIVDVGAPMQHKALCYEMLLDAEQVIGRSPDEVFRVGCDNLVLVMDMTGRLDVAAPMPPKGVALQMLKDGREVIERFNDASAPELRPFDRRLMGEG
jgi:hypothetical protein